MTATPLDGAQVASLTRAAASGDRRAALEALRAHLAAAIEAADPEKIAPLAKQLRETVAEIEALPNAKEKSTSDDLAAKRSARRAAAKVADNAAGGNQ